MELRLYTLHSRGRPDDLVAVGDGINPLGLVPPLWAVWRGLWLTLVAMAALVAAAALWHPLVLGVLIAGLTLIAVLDGAAIERAELRLRGWREVGVVEAASEEGAEELYLTGRAA